VRNSVRSHRDPGRVKISLQGVGRVFAPTSKRSSSVVALKGVNGEVFEEEIVGLLGPSGCGKTTLLNLIAGFDRQDEGEIIVAGKKVERPGPDRMVVFQFPALFAWLTVWENVVFGPKERRENAKDYEPRARSLLDSVGLKGREHDYPYQLSGGMKQRVQLARALLNQPQELLHNVWSLYHPTILLVTHDAEEALYLCHRIYVMDCHGGIRETIHVPFPFPRKFDLIGSTDFAHLKYTLLSALRTEEERPDCHRQVGEKTQEGEAK
jgi:NitT/TauT family transport system ATP-binding protein